LFISGQSGSKRTIFATKPRIGKEVVNATFQNCLIDLLWCAGDPVVVFPSVFASVSYLVTKNCPTVTEKNMFTAPTIGNAYLHGMKELCSIYRTPSPTKEFTVSRTFTASKKSGESAGGGGGSGQKGTRPMVGYSIAVAVATGLLVLVISALVYSGIEGICLYDSNNWIHVDV
jgi:hypothetical protein